MFLYYFQFFFSIFITYNIPSLFIIHYIIVDWKISRRLQVAKCIEQSGCISATLCSRDSRSRYFLQSARAGVPCTLFVSLVDQCTRERFRFHLMAEEDRRRRARVTGRVVFRLSSSNAFLEVQRSRISIRGQQFLCNIDQYVLSVSNDYPPRLFAPLAKLCH